MSIEDPARLLFRERPDIRQPRKRASSWSAGWLMLAFVAVVAFVLLVRAMLERSAHTAGPSPAAVDMRSDAALKAEPAADLQSAAQAGAGRAYGGADAQQHRAAALADIRQRRADAASLIYRCVAGNGAVSFQQQPCGAGQEVTRVIHAPPDRRPARPVQLYRLPEGERRQAGYTYAAASSESDRDRRKRNCAMAKQHRENTLKAVGMARTYDLLQKLDAQVYEACKGL